MRDKYKMLLAVIFLLLCCGLENTHAKSPYLVVQPDPIKEPWRWQTFPELNGLGLQCMATGKNGVMWFGIDDGVMCYDGMRWTRYTSKDGLVRGPIHELLVAQNGDVYAGSDEGISRFASAPSYDGKKWQRIFPLGGHLPWSIFSIVESRDGSLWAGTAWGALNIRKDTTILYTTEEMVASIRTRTPWLTYRWVPEHIAPLRGWRKGTGMRVIPGIAPLSAVVWAVAPNGPAEKAGILVGDRILAVNQHPRVTDNQIDGEVGTSVVLSVKRLAQSDTVEKVLTRDEVAGQFRDFHIYSVFEDASGDLWFGMGTHLQGGEVVRYRPDWEGDYPDAWTLFSKEDGVLKARTPLFDQDTKGHIVMVNAQPQVGVQTFDGKLWRQRSFLQLDQDAGLSGAVSWADAHTSLRQMADGGVWVGGQGGRLHTRYGNTWRVYTFPDIPISQVRIIDIVEDRQGVVWLGGLAQVAVRLDYDSGRWQSYKNLHFQCETLDGRQWFITQQYTVVSFDGKRWTQYDADDGVMESVSNLFVTRDGTLWALGSHQGRAATGQWDGQSWINLQTHPQFAEAVHIGAVFEALNGDLWIGAGSNGDITDNILRGALRFDGETWHHYAPPEVPHYVYAIGQAGDDNMWLGGSSLRLYDGQKWAAVLGPEELVRWGGSGMIETMHSDHIGSVWLGTRGYGIFQYDGTRWTRHNVQHGLSDNTIKAILATSDDNIWAATNKGISRFDGHTWTTHALPPQLAPVHKHGLKMGRDGAIWINRSGSGTFETVRYIPDDGRPDTEIVEWVDEVTQPGNVTISWQGSDLWARTASDQLQYAWRLDQGAWSVFGSQTSKTLLEVGSGTHTFQVKARDRDFNEDPTPAVITFLVIPPVWQQPWFVGLMMVLLGMIGLQTYRVITRERRLQAANVTLGEQNRDLSEARAAAEAASESKSAFLANMSHEIRTPLNAILGYARLLLRRDELVGDTRQSIGTIESSGTHLLTLINNILDLSRIESGRIELEQADFDLMVLMRDIQAMFAVSCQEKGIDWQMGWYDEAGVETAAPEALHVYGDVGKLRQVLINLVGNAIKFTPGGHVSLRVSHLPNAELPMHQNRYRFEVVDDGRGIYPEDQAAIFEPFEQGHHGSRAGGTGLGLAIARRYIQLMGGELDLESEAGKGSRFFFNLPLVPAERIPLTDGAVPDRQVMALADGYALDVVVVDDVLENRQVLSQVLISIGATVRLANNGKEALDVVADKMPDIVLMDIWMPEMDGQAATRRIKALYGDKAPPVVAVSASVLAHERTQFQAAGFDDFVAKPVHEGRLFATMAKILGLKYLYQEDVDTTLNLGDVILPGDLYNELRQAAEFGEVTQLEDLVEQVRALGTVAHPLADQLWRLSRRLDLDAILKLLDGLQREA